ncbi:MAG: plasmid pRiA4b ORF-3 family protein [Thermoguttaceae bacterium]|jgi:hypothetical protein
MPLPIFIFKVALAGRKSIWRKIAVKGNQTLDDLHGMIFDAFDRYDDHLYSFFFPLKAGKITPRKIHAESVEYTSPNTLEFGGDDGQKDASKAKFSTLKLKKKQVFYYLFDFGDEWWHEITVEETDAKEEKGKYPRIVEQKGKSPPQYPDSEEEEEEEEEEE